MAESTEAVPNTFSTLADPARRYVLDYLDEQETPVSLDPLATRVAAWHTDSDPDAVDGATSTEMRTALYHVHLPKLAEAGYIEWEKDTHRIRRGPNFDEIAPLLRLMADHEDELPAGWPEPNEPASPHVALPARWRTQAEPSASRHDSEDEATTVLYSCPACERTYISEEMDACSECGEPVTQVPSERELGISQSRE